MAIYLIDYENTSVKGLVGIEKLKEEDLVIIFYGPKTGAVPFDEHVKISTAASHVEYIKTTKTAKNYLDFQLTSYLGYLIATTAVKSYYIISRDSGYDSVVDFWTKRGILVKRMENVAGFKKAADSVKNKTAAAKNNRNTQNVADSAHGEETEKNAKTVPAVDNRGNIQENPKETGQDNKQVSKQNNPKAGKQEEKQNSQKNGKQEEKQNNQKNGKQEEKQHNIIEKDQEDKINTEEHKEAPEHMAHNPGTVPESIRKRIRNNLKDQNLQAGAYRQIYACMLKASDKQTFNIALVRTFTQEKGNILYKSILPIFNEWMKG